MFFLRCAFSGVLLALAGLACSTPAAKSEAKVCIPGKAYECPCPGGGQGTQYCNDVGSALEKCECGGVPATDAGSTPVDTFTPTEDAAPPAVDTTTCVAHFSKVCEQNDAYWFDSCGTKGELAKTCIGEETCVGGECVTNCQPKAKKGCNGNNVFWFDSCGKPGGVADICLEEQFCKDGATPTCVKPFYNGTWQVTADPDQKPLPGGLGNAYFPPTDFELVIDGTKATGDIKAFDPPVHYEGTLDGKVLKLVADFTESGFGSTHHHETMIVTFSSPTEFAGTDTDELEADIGLGEPTPLGKIIWEIKGKKK